ncbi:putative transposase, ISSmu1, partial [Chlamydia psittaci 01DC11]
IFLL